MDARKGRAGIESGKILLRRTTLGIDFEQVKELYKISHFDNGRDAETLQRCFEKSQHVCFAISSDLIVIGTARAISDETSCAAIFDVCVHPSMRRLGIGHRMMQTIMNELPGQFVILTTNVPSFYTPLSFRRENRAMSTVLAMDEDESKPIG
jgi:ribosomal protein S18 acetylase RimI-like enzyme